MARRIRDYAAEYQARQRKAQTEGYRSYGAKRYAKERERDRERQQRPTVEVTAGPSRGTREARAVDAIIRASGGEVGSRQRDRIEQGVAGMSDRELRRAASATPSKIREMAKRDARDFPPVGIDDDGEPIYRNPYWYH